VRPPMIALLVLLSGNVLAAESGLPKAEVPGSSPVGQAPTPASGQRVEPTPVIDPNLPRPEPVAPQKHPDSAPNLPGSGRKEPVPAS
jgi:hypothetical protein